MSENTVTGVVEDMEHRQASGGGQYTILRFAGVESGYFDWTSQLAADGVRVGDEITVQHDGGKYPRVGSVTVVKRGSGGSTTRPTPASGASAGQANGKPNGRDVSIVRQVCVKAAAAVLANSGLAPGESAKAVGAVAGKLEEWVLR